MAVSREQSDPIGCPEVRPGESKSQTDGPPREGATVGDANPAGTATASDQDVAEWVTAAQSGDREAFECLVVHFQDRVWRRALYRIKDREEAYDLAQEVFLICFQKLYQFRGEAKFWTWLCRVVDNQVKNRQAWLQRRGKGRTYSLDAPADRNEGDQRRWDPPDPKPGPRREAQSHEAFDALQRNLNELSDDHREILLLRFSDDLSYEEIGEALGLTLGTVKSRINRARNELRVLMSDHLE